MALIEKSSTNSLEKIKVLRSKNQQAVGFIIFTIVVVIVLIVGAIAPSITTIITTRETISKNKLTHEQLSKKIQNQDELRKQYQQMGTLYKDIQLIYPDSGDFSYFMANVDNVTTRYSYELTSIRFEDDHNFDEINTTVLAPTSVDIVVRGPFENAIELLRGIEQMPMYPEVIRYSFALDEDTDSRELLELLDTEGGDAGEQTGNEVVQSGANIVDLNMKLKIYQINQPNFYEGETE